MTKTSFSFTMKNLKNKSYRAHLTKFPWKNNFKLWITAGTWNKKTGKHPYSKTRHYHINELSRVLSKLKKRGWYKS